MRCQTPTISAAAATLDGCVLNCLELCKICMLLCSYVRVNTEGTLQSDDYATLRECGERVLHGDLSRGIPCYKAPEGGMRQPAGMQSFLHKPRLRSSAVFLTKACTVSWVMWPEHLQVGTRSTSRAAGC